MNREQLAHVLRAAARIAGDGDILVLGSQSVLGTKDEGELPEAATRSVEADIAFRDDPDVSKADRVDGGIGEYSQFHRTFGYYAQGVEVGTAVLPAGWQERVVPFDREDAHPSHARCLEVHDLVIAKLVAGRPKDIEFAETLLGVQLVEADTLLERAQLIDQPELVRRRVRTHVHGCAERAGEWKT